MSKTWWLIVGLPALLALFFVSRAIGSDEKKSSSADVFDGKILTISAKGSATYGAVLERVKIRELGGKSFLVGTAVDIGVGSWTKGRITWYAVDEAAQIIEFDSVQQIRRVQQEFAP